MFPTLRNRLWIAVAVAVGAAGWLMAGGWLAAHDGSTGYTLTTANGGWLITPLTLMLAALPAMITGVLVSAAGHPLAGVFSTTVGLLFLAACGGSPEGWLLAIDGPGTYRLLALEMALWMIGLVALLAAIERGRGPLVARWPWLDRGEASHDDRLLGAPSPQAMLAGLVTLVVGGAVSFLLVRSADTGQVVGGLLIGFGLGAMAARTLLPEARLCLPVLLAPGVAAIMVYLYVSMQYATQEELLAARFAQTALDAGLTNRLPSLALALPIHYASAAVAGCAMGLGLGNAINAGRQEVAAQAA